MFIQKFLTAGQSLKSVNDSLFLPMTQRAAYVAVYSFGVEHLPNRNATVMAKPKKVLDFWKCIQPPNPTAHERGRRCMLRKRLVVGRGKTGITIPRELPSHGVFFFTKQLNRDGLNSVHHVLRKNEGKFSPIPSSFMVNFSNSHGFLLMSERAFN